MSSVYFDPAVGGDGSTVTDDASPTTGLANGGHRTRFVPALAQVVAIAEDVVTNAQDVLASVADAEAAAATAIAAPGTSATSTTSLAIGTGSKTFTIQTGKALVVGQFVIAASAANVANYMFGQISAHNSSTGQLTLNVTAVGGSGTLADWSIGLSAPGAGDVTLAGAQTFTGAKTFAGTSSNLAMVLNDAAEVATVSATAATGTIAYDITTQSVLYYTSNASANWTVNFRGSSGTSLNTLMSTGQSMTVAFLVTQGATAYFNNAVQVDGTTSGVTTRWLGGAPTAGNASGIDSYRYLIIKTGSATFTVLASNTQFKA